MPSYKTVERAMGSLLEELDSFFTQILHLCGQMGLIGEERIYIDGTKNKANASRHKANAHEASGSAAVLQPSCIGGR